MPKKRRPACGPPIALNPRPKGNISAAPATDMVGGAGSVPSCGPPPLDGSSVEAVPSNAPLASSGPAEPVLIAEPLVPADTTTPQVPSVQAVASGPPPDEATPPLVSTLGAANASNGWANLFKDNRNGFKLGTKLKFIPSSDDVILVDDSHILDSKQAWGHALLGYFAGRFPGKAALLNLCASWNVKFRYIPHSSGWLVFKFQSEADLLKVLCGGPYFAFGRSLLLKEVPEGFEFEKFTDSKTPVWVRFEKLGPHLWSDEILGRMASKLGNPLYTDMLTRTKDRLEYARVLVEIDLCQPLQNSVSLKFSNGVEKVYEVTYEKLPNFCTHCKSFKHASGNCRTTAKAVPNSPVKGGIEHMRTSPSKEGNENAATQPTIIQARSEKPSDSLTSFASVDTEESVSITLGSETSKSASTNGNDKAPDDEFIEVKSRSQRKTERRNLRIEISSKLSPSISSSAKAWVSRAKERQGNHPRLSPSTKATKAGNGSTSNGRLGPRPIQSQ